MSLPAALQRAYSCIRHNNDGGAMTLSPLRLHAGLAAAVLLALAAGNAAAQADQALYVRSLAATCANCHGTDGRAGAGATVPGLAGLSREHIVTQMQAFKAGTRPATVMHQIAKGYSDAQVAQLADWFAARKP
jgi:cytochrome c553